MDITDLARVLEAAAAECRAIAAEQTQERLDWIDQRQSPLGPRRHCAAVRARQSAGKDGCAIVGRRHLLSPEAVAEALQTTIPAPPPSEPDEVEAMRAELALVRGGRR